jgi:hypothetical protein
VPTEMPTATLFERALVARESPQNECFAREGELLAVALAPSWPTAERSHHFIGAETGHASKYGWVFQLSKPMTISNFMARIERRGLAASEDVQLKMLEAAARLKIGDAVAAEFVSRGVEQKVIHLLVHKVIFHAS